MADENVSLEFLAQQSQRMIETMRTLQRDVADIRTLALQTHDAQRRAERRINELKDDLVVMLKAELMGSLTHSDTKHEHRLNALKDEIGAMLRPMVQALPEMQRRISALEQTS